MYDIKEEITKENMKKYEKIILNNFKISGNIEKEQKKLQKDENSEINIKKLENFDKEWKKNIKIMEKMVKKEVIDEMPKLKQIKNLLFM